MSLSKRGKTAFQDDWLDRNIFSDWTWLEKVDSDKSKGRCCVCNTNFDVSNMGISSVKSHAKGKKHIDRVKAVIASKKLFDFRPPSSPSTPVCSQMHVSNMPIENISINQNCSTKENDLKVVCGAGGSFMPSSSALDRFVNKDEVTCAEITWALNMIVTHYSARSASAASDLFKYMFPDSDIAKKFQMHKDKLGYVVTYGLGPFFQKELSNTIKQCDFYAVSFDESLNEVAQKGQMDIVVRFWGENEVKTRFLTSCFLGHATAHDLLMNFISALKEQGLNLKNMMQVSMDGPNVNLKFLKDLKSYLREDSPDDPELLSFGTCALHIVHGAFKTAHDKCDWNIPSFLRCIYYLFKNFPTRRADYQFLTQSSLFPLKFCCIRWVENSKVLQRAGAMLPHLKKYINLVEKNPPQSENFKKLKVTVKDELLAAKLGFMSSISIELESFLTDYQTNRPLLPFMYTDLNRLIVTLMNKVVNPDIMSTATSTQKIIGIDLMKKCNLKSYQSLDIGFAASSALKGVKEILVLQFKKDCQAFLVELCLKLMKKCPLSYKLVRGASCLSPEVMMNSTLRNQRVTAALEVLVEHKQLACEAADLAKREYLHLLDKQSIQEQLKNFNRNNDQLDHFLYQLLDKEKVSKAFINFVQKILVLFHSNAAVERSFSVNKQCLVENLLQDSLVAQRSVYDAVISAGSVQDITITKQMIHSFRNASAKRSEALKKKKTQEDDKVFKQKRAAEEIRILELKKRDILQQAKEEAEALESEVKKLKQVL